MADIFKGFGCVLAANVEQDFFAAAVPRGKEGLVSWGPKDWDWKRGCSFGVVGGCLRMLVDKGGSIVDFVVDDWVGSE